MESWHLGDTELLPASSGAKTCRHVTEKKDEVKGLILYISILARLYTVMYYILNINAGMCTDDVVNQAYECAVAWIESTTL